MHVQIEDKPAAIQGNYFHQEPFATDAKYFVAYEDETPVGQLALVKKGQFWWLDYLFVDPRYRKKGVVPILIREIYPYAAEITDYVFANCEGVTPADLARNNDRYGVSMEVLRHGISPKDGRPFTVIRRNLTALRKKRTA